MARLCVYLSSNLSSGSRKISPRLPLSKVYSQCMHGCEFNIKTTVVARETQKEISWLRTNSPLIPHSLNTACECVMYVTEKLHGHAKPADLLRNPALHSKKIKEEKNRCDPKKFSAFLLLQLWYSATMTMIGTKKKTSKYKKKAKGCFHPGSNRGPFAC